MSDLLINLRKIYEDAAENKLTFEGVKDTLSELARNTSWPAPQMADSIKLIVEKLVGEDRTDAAIHVFKQVKGHGNFESPKSELEYAERRKAAERTAPYLQLVEDTLSDIPHAKRFDTILQFSRELRGLFPEKNEEFLRKAYDAIPLVPANKFTNTKTIANWTKDPELKKMALVEWLGMIDEFPERDRYSMAYVLREHAGDFDDIRALAYKKMEKWAHVTPVAEFINDMRALSPAGPEATP